MRGGLVIVATIGLAACVDDDSDESSGGAASASSEVAASSASSDMSSSQTGLPEGTPHVRWLRHWGAKKTDERITAVVVEPDESVVVAGTIGTFDVAEIPVTSIDAEDILLARFDAEGELEASRVLGGRSHEGPRAMARRSDGTFTMLGSFSDTLAAFEPALETFGGASVFVGAFGPSFESLWGRALVGAATGRGQATMATTGSGAIVAAGTFHEALVTEAGVIPVTGPSDAYVARFSADGDTEWVVAFGGPEVAHLEVGASVAVGEEVVVAGQLRGTLRTSAGTELATSFDARRAFIARFDQDGDLTAFRLIQSSGTVAITRLARRPSGLLGSVSHEGAIATQAGELVGLGEGDAALLWLDGAGAPLFGKAWGDERSQGISAVDASAAGDILMAGVFLGGVDFGDGYHKTSDGRPDGFAAVLSPTGVARATVIATDAVPVEGKSRNSQVASAVGWLPGGEIIVAGNYSGTMVLGDASAEGTGGVDAFIARVVLP